MIFNVRTVKRQFRENNVFWIHPRLFATKYCKIIYIQLKQETKNFQPTIVLLSNTLLEIKHEM
jgi:hypothetical protein